MNNKSVLIQGICYDDKSSFQRGPAKAPQLIRDRLWSDASNNFAENGIEIHKRSLIDKGDFNIKNYWDIYDLTMDHLLESPHILSLGGDHSITYPVIKAIATVHPGIQILHIDAHGDLYDEFEGDKYSHACPFARIMEDRLVKKLVQVGIRTLTPHQREQAQKYDVTIIEMKNFATADIPDLEGPVYISLDMDAFDPSFAPGVSHQESGGLFPRDVLNLIHNIKGAVIGADIVEYNPENDLGGITSVLAAKMMKEIISFML